MRARAKPMEKRMRHLVPALLALCLLLAGQARSAPLVFTSDDIFPESTPQGTGYLDRIVADALSRLGLSPRTEHLPSERGLHSANGVEADGVYCRVAGLEEEFPNLIMVPEPLYQYTFTAFTHGSGIAVRNWADLAPYDVGIIKGWKAAERNIGTVRSLHRVGSDAALFRMLALDRIDVAVHGLVSGRILINALGLSGIIAQAPPLAVEDMYVYLNSRHAALVPRLAQVLREMKEDGTVQRIRAEVLKEAGVE